MPAPVFGSVFFPELHYRACAPPRKSFTPRFDVRETEKEYIVEGELPGVTDKSSLSVEFTCKGDLVVRGQVERSRTTLAPAQPQTASPEAQKGERKDVEVAPTPTSSAPSSPRSLKPTVEDVPDEDEWMGITESPAKKLRAEEQTAKKKEEKVVRKKEEWPKRLLSERSVGEFARSFTFPVGIDCDSVTASLEHGILRIVVPKRLSGAGKRIEVL